MQRAKQFFCAVITAISLSSGADDDQLFIFDESVHWAMSKTEIDRRLARIQAAGFTDYAPTAWYGEGAHFRSKTYAPHPRLKSVTDHFDPMAYLVERAHQLNIQVHPWITVMRRGGGTLDQFHENGVPDNAYNVHDPAFRDFIVSLIVEIIDRYDIDGINLDYIRSMGICTAATCVDAYEKYSKRNLKYDVVAWRLDTTAEQQLTSWQAHAVGDIVKRVAKHIERHRPNVYVTTTMHSGSDRTGSIEGRDTVTWIQNGWVDAAFDMQYLSIVDHKSRNDMGQHLEEPWRLGVLIANYRNTPVGEVPHTGADLVTRLDRLSHKTPRSVKGVYLYNLLTMEQIKALGNPLGVRRE